MSAAAVLTQGAGRRCVHTHADRLRARLAACAPRPGSPLSITLPWKRGHITIQGHVAAIHRDGLLLRSAHYSVFIAWVDLYHTDRPTRIVAPAAAARRMGKAVGEMRGGVGAPAGK
jgi:hypothetical protein